MLNKLFAIAALVAGLIALPSDVFAATGSNYPFTVLKNQYGEVSINSVIGGSSLDCQFTVSATDAAGNGVTGLSGSACSAVYMHTSATASAGNPNPAVGYIIVQLAKNYYQYLNGYSAFITAPLSGSNILATTGVTAGLGYVITSVGTTSAAQWQHLGLPLGLTPTTNQAFIAPGTTTATGTGAMQVPATSGSGIFTVDLVGDPDQETGATSGAIILLRAMAATNSSTTTLVATAPANGSIVNLHLSMLPLSSQLK